MNQQAYIYISNSFSYYGANCLRRLVEEGHAPSFVVGLNRKTKKNSGLAIFAKLSLDEIARYAGIVLGKKLSLLSPELSAEYFLEEVAQDSAIPYAEVASLNSDAARQLLAKQQADAAVVCSLSQILGEKTLAVIPIYNVHLGGLPENRGANPIERSVLLGEAHVAASVHRMTKGIDEGDIFSRSEVAIGACFRWSCVMKSSVKAGTQAIGSFLTAWQAGELEGQSQLGVGTYYPKVTLGEKYLARLQLGYRFVYRRFTS